MAPSLSLLCGETISQKIHEHASIKGIRLGHLHRLMAQFADDTQMFLDSKESVENTISTLVLIEKNIGLTVNYDKSCICSIGEAKSFQCSKLLIWDPGGLTVLGIELTPFLP